MFTEAVGVSPLAGGAAMDRHFREAPLRQVFEALSRSSNINFVFDKDVRSDTRITIFLRNVTLDEAMRVILNTQQLDRKLLNETSVLIFPNTSAKQREHQELVTRSLYLRHGEAKALLGLLREASALGPVTLLLRGFGTDGRGERGCPATNDLPVTMRLAEPPESGEWLRSA